LQRYNLALYGTFLITFFPSCTVCTKYHVFLIFFHLPTFTHPFKYFFQKLHRSIVPRYSKGQSNSPYPLVGSFTVYYRFSSYFLSLSLHVFSCYKKKLLIAVGKSDQNKPDSEIIWKSLVWSYGAWYLKKIFLEFLMSLLNALWGSISIKIFLCFSNMQRAAVFAS
jgi:hypothetical protein